ncbi:hypothetical protein VNO77_17640 [Canavalia gladiata]|uniref:Uncharacterized protein n=1 Tax=Canavalia gladiata TaxID=3824 RepID=A0AAN9LJI6_CANGL
MKALAFFLAIIVVTSRLGELRASGLGGIYGQEQRNRVGRGKVIESIEKEKIINANYPKSSVERASYHGKPKQNYNKGDGTTQEDVNRNKYGKFKHILVHA